MIHNNNVSSANNLTLGTLSTDRSLLQKSVPRIDPGGTFAFTLVTTPMSEHLISLQKPVSSGSL